MSAENVIFFDGSPNSFCLVKPSARSDYMQKLKTLIDAKPGVSTRVLAKELGVAHTTINKIRKNGIPIVVEAKKPKSKSTTKKHKL